jgi:hypothetical protein
MPSPAVTIPHDAYPHIVEAILASADWDALLPFRATSRHFRALADKHLGYHVALTAERVVPHFEVGKPIICRARVSLREPVAPYRLLPGYPPREVGITDGDRGADSVGGFIWEEAFPVWPPVAVLDTYGLSPGTRPCDIRLAVMRDWTSIAQRCRPHQMLLTDCLVRSSLNPEEVTAHTAVVHSLPSGITPSECGGLRQIIYILPRPAPQPPVPCPAPQPPVPTSCRFLAFPAYTEAEVTVLNLQAAVARALEHDDPPRIVVVGMEDLAAPHDAASAGADGLYGFLRYYVATSLARASYVKKEDLDPRIELIHFASRAELDQMGLHPAARDPALPMPDHVWRTGPRLL